MPATKRERDDTDDARKKRTSDASMMEELHHGLLLRSVPCEGECAHCGEEFTPDMRVYNAGSNERYCIPSCANQCTHCDTFVDMDTLDGETDGDGCFLCAVHCEGRCDCCGIEVGFAEFAVDEEGVKLAEHGVKYPAPVFHYQCLKEVTDSPTVRATLERTRELHEASKKK